ncbi:glycosyltransferase family 4 protein [Trinickia sp. EG282A]|uniref:glycosyltransferase family 4 protein n=1 Tax=Trinickia sp. EG282A TaxID=3237013 RepID=UPI0034D25C2D
MKIAIVTHAVRHNDGQGRVNYEVAVAALAQGCEVTLVASQVSPALLADPRVRWVPIRIPRAWPTNLLRHQLFAIKSAAWLRKHHREYDVLHVNGFISWVRADVNTAHFVHGGWMRSPYYPYGLTRGLHSAYQYVYTRVNARLERWAYRRSLVVAAVSQKVAAELRETGITAEKIEVVHNGVDTRAFAEASGTRSAFGLADDGFLLLFAGDLRTPRKNLGTVLRALPRLPPHVHVVVAGSVKGSPYPDEAHALGVAGRVHFLDFVENVPALMHCVDAYVFPSRYEAMSLSLLEAMAAGLPVVTARTAGGAEIIDPECGIVLDDPDDVDALAGAVGRLAGDERLRCAMGAAASRVAQRFGWERMGAQYMEIYRRVVRFKSDQVGERVGSTDRWMQMEGGETE